MERVKGFCDGCPEFKRDMVWLGTSIFVTCSCNCGECVMEEKTFDADYTTTDSTTTSGGWSARSVRG